VLLDPLAPARPSTVAGLLDTVPSTGLRELAPTFPAELGDFPERLALARPRLSSYATLVGSTFPEVGSLDQLLLLAGSTDITEEERSAYVEEVLARTEERFQQVKAPDRRQTVTLTSSDGDVPLTLLNDLDVPATVTVDVRSNAGRIEIRGFERTQVLRPGTNPAPHPGAHPGPRRRPPSPSPCGPPTASSPSTRSTTRCAPPPSPASGSCSRPGPSPSCSCGGCGTGSATAGRGEAATVGGGGGGPDAPEPDPRRRPGRRRAPVPRARPDVTSTPPAGSNPGSAPTRCR
jgi:hypothetical protein